MGCTRGFEFPFVSGRVEQAGVSRDDLALSKRPDKRVTRKTLGFIHAHKRSVITRSKEV